MRHPASTPPLAELLRKSRELRIRLMMHSDHAAKLKASIEQSRKQAPHRSLFSPE
jgi:ABC-type Fe3+-citrate transport system substrate-binding protein